MSNTRLSQKELFEYQEAFAFYDSDRDGYISISGKRFLYAYSFNFL